jgi:hypothetical protein
MESIRGASMPDVCGVEFNANQSELVKDLVRELLKDGNCAVYPVPHIPHGELQMASIPPIPGLRGKSGVFLRIRPGVNEATIVRPMSAKAGEPLAKLNKSSRVELLDVIRAWRQQTMLVCREEKPLPDLCAVSASGA